MTYSEFAALTGCKPSSARDAVCNLQLDRRRSRDGHTRVKLSPQLIEMFLDQLMRHWIDQNMGECVDELRDLRERMARPPAVSMGASERQKAFAARVS
jgi:hypothetical protein